MKKFRILKLDLHRNFAKITYDIPLDMIILSFANTADFPTVFGNLLKESVSAKISPVVIPSNSSNSKSKTLRRGRHSPQANQASLGNPNG